MKTRILELSILTHLFSSFLFASFGASLRDNVCVQKAIDAGYVSTGGGDKYFSWKWGKIVDSTDNKLDSKCRGEVYMLGMQDAEEYAKYLESKGYVQDAKAQRGGVDWVRSTWGGKAFNLCYGEIGSINDSAVQLASSVDVISTGDGSGTGSREYGVDREKLGGIKNGQLPSNPIITASMEQVEPKELSLDEKIASEIGLVRIHPASVGKIEQIQTGDFPALRGRIADNKFAIDNYRKNEGKLNGYIDKLDTQLEACEEDTDRDTCSENQYFKAKGRKKVAEQMLAKTIEDRHTTEKMNSQINARIAVEKRSFPNGRNPMALDLENNKEENVAFKAKLERKNTEIRDSISRYNNVIEQYERLVSDADNYRRRGGSVDEKQYSEVKAEIAKLKSQVSTLQRDRNETDRKIKGLDFQIDKTEDRIEEYY